MKTHLIDIPKFNVVMADDDSDDRYMFMNAFKELTLDIHTHIVENGLELIQYLKTATQIPDIIFLDLNMPLMNGFECLKTLKQDHQYETCCFVIFSTSSRQQDIDETFLLGANIYLTKPESFNELKDLLYKVILFNCHYQRPEINRDSFVMSLGSRL